MAVFTPLTLEEVAEWLGNYSIGTPLALNGISSGIENSNFFLTTTHGRYVLTVFEKLTRTELPFYIHLMAHLARHGIPCPAPIADRDNEFLGTLKGKPAAIVTRLPGSSVMAPDAAHCAAIGAMLADLHVAGQSFGRRLDNPRGLAWWRSAAEEVRGFLSADDAALLDAEIAFQSAAPRDDLPAGVVHADLFRDNCLFDDSDDTPGAARVGGIIDFYFAGNEALLFDVAVTVNDWCDNGAGHLDPARTHALLSAYARTRPFTAAERAAWPGMLRGAALRFWLSRLVDRHLPRAGELVHPKNPDQYRELLRVRIAEAAAHALPG